MMLHVNFEYLSGYFEMYGLKYYVRMSRFGELQYENPFDFEDVFGNTVQLTKISARPKLMYNYLIFSLRNSKLKLWTKKEKRK